MAATPIQKDKITGLSLTIKAVIFISSELTIGSYHEQ